MAEKISAYRANDGKVFDTFKEAQAHDLNNLRAASVAALVESIGASAATVSVPTDDPDAPVTLSLSSFLIAHHVDLLAALSVKPKSWSRKAKSKDKTATPHPESGAAA